jgi:hypothetical protein
MSSKQSLVITSISPPNPVLRTCAEECDKRGVDFIVIGDVASPPDFSLNGCDFWSIDRQKKLDFKLAGILPERHYARKNIGYLIAIRNGSEIIIETDDDNFPLESFWQRKSPVQMATLIEDKGWVNVFRYFTDSFIWPRGFPLEYAHHPVSSLVGVAEQQVFSPIQQGLANGNPDVDAIYRLLFPLPHMFAGNRTIALGSNSYCPFNSQNTVWFKEAYPLLYLPSTCSFRMTDIWRSFIAQRISQENGWHILFHSPTVWQERNAHNLLNDFSDEIPGYLGNAKIWDLLQATDIRTGLHAVHDNLRRVYICLVENGYFDEFELLLLDGWLSDLSSSIK